MGLRDGETGKFSLSRAVMRLDLREIIDASATFALVRALLWTTLAIGR